ncbi:MAG: hypothetical protein QW756_03150 [Nitrososphaerota archaeon]
MFVRQRTALPVVLYGLYLVALGLSFRCASRALKPFIGRSHEGCLEVGSEAPKIQKVLQG